MFAHTSVSIYLNSETKTTNEKEQKNLLYSRLSKSYQVMGKQSGLFLMITRSGVDALSSQTRLFITGWLILLQIELKFQLILAAILIISDYLQLKDNNEYQLGTQ